MVETSSEWISDRLIFFSLAGTGNMFDFIFYHVISPFCCYFIFSSSFLSFENVRIQYTRQETVNPCWVTEYISQRINIKLFDYIFSYGEYESGMNK